VLTLSSVLFVPKTVHTLVLVCAGLAGVVLYWRRLDDVR
jgi:hypothetical protein